MYDSGSALPSLSLHKILWSPGLSMFGNACPCSYKNFTRALCELLISLYGSAILREELAEVAELTDNILNTPWHNVIVNLQPKCCMYSNCCPLISTYSTLSQSPSSLAWTVLTFEILEASGTCVRVGCLVSDCLIRCPPLPPCNLYHTDTKV